MKRNRLILFAITIFYFCISCKKFVEIPPPKNQLVNNVVFSDSMNATSAVLGVYINMMPNFTAQMTNGGLSIYCGMSSDELSPSANNTDENGFYNNALAKDNSINNSLWVTAFSILYNTNACIEGLENSNSLTLSVRQQLLGESKFARAFLYFNLVNLYGAVPLITRTDYKINKTLARTSVDSVYKLIISDLLEAQNFLSDNYITTDRFRPNKHAARALLAKAHLYQKDWSKAEDITDQIINSGIYRIESDLNNVYKTNSSETIWKLQMLYPGFETWEGYFFIPPSWSPVPYYVASNNLVSAFESGDERKLKWLNANIVNGETYYYPYKYKIVYSGADRIEDFTVFRLSEQHLIRAEARAHSNNLSGALADLNIIRNRAGLPNLSSTLNQTQILDAVEQERRVELFCEWGNRWFDLKRTNRADVILAAVKGTNWQSGDVLYPIPQSELNKNPFLIQNSGY